MQLLIDAGNTRLKWCWYDGDELPLEMESCAYDDLEEQGVDLFRSSGPDVTGVLICNVAGVELADRLNRGFKAWGLVPVYLNSQKACAGVQNAYEQPENLGVDRWMSVLGAWKMRQDACCIVDCGTAVTIDVMTDSGRHLGGIIVPGMEMMQESLIEETAGISGDKVPSEMQSADSMLARDTEGAIIMGSLYALVALIERVRAEVEQEMGYELPLILTGGDTDMIQPLLSCESLVEPMLVFHGMIAAMEA